MIDIDNRWLLFHPASCVIQSIILHSSCGSSEKTPLWAENIRSQERKKEEKAVYNPNWCNDTIRPTSMLLFRMFPPRTVLSKVEPASEKKQCCLCSSLPRRIASDLQCTSAGFPTSLRNKELGAAVWRGVQSPIRLGRLGLCRLSWCCQRDTWTVVFKELLPHVPTSGWRPDVWRHAISALV